ncbi:TetR family transcriptional regulator [Sphingobium rhizovicinum]|uniref:TetR family transcriptional regulator n=1 Tax=Sphingobium rhizovicinum TaxID=432308 RepID=A0ABV7NNV1_9SPHN
MTEVDKKTSYNRLIEAIFTLWEDGGGEAVSARQISVTASVPVSSIYHHFGSLERLFLVAQEEAQGRARLWCADRLAQLDGLSVGAAAFPAFFATLVDDWATGQRPIAFAWREGQLWRTESEAAAQVRADWTLLWSAFWRQACAHFGVQSQASLIEYFFDNEAFTHMIAWRRAVDRAGLDEFARGVGAWLTGHPVPPAPWRDFARLEALSNAPDAPEHDGTTSQIAEAAAALIEEAGPSAVTHRAVAERAGLTLGVVSHKRRTKAELLQVGFEAVYVSAVGRLHARTATIAQADPEAALDGLADFMAASLGGRGTDALHLGVARDPALRHFGLQLRYLRGTTSRHLLIMLRPDRPDPSHLEAALMSAFLSAVGRRHADSAVDDARVAIHADLAALVALL